ncbi:hypothetical protein FE257_011886 [Aspergillus nanangensis]|uniref:Uncharacterized protein n=1 Tax=Aspergillus nanangensis TaxID=2582783 RepID=A0AAD4GSD2_ASPNN|nr:hypothetical protein FE257_011886 [Aspergillus nanangensis]
MPENPIPACNLMKLLKNVVEKAPSRGITVHGPGNMESPIRLSYRDIHEATIRNAGSLGSIPGFQRGSIVLLHLDNHVDNIIWLWSLLYAGCIPVMSTPFPHDERLRRAHLLHLKSLLHNPICLTHEKLVGEFGCQNTILQLRTVESIGSNKRHCTETPKDAEPSTTDDSIAIIMLTSGSTGHAKGVPLTHRQIQTSLAGKQQFLSLGATYTTLNWIALDHVASLLEMHFHPMLVNMDQIHVHPADIVADPRRLLHFISQYRVQKVFAPNFLLANLYREIETMGPLPDPGWDLSCLQYLVSGGESNTVQCCATLADILSRYKAPMNCIVPSFGMTETCAGFTWNTNFPAYDMSKNFEFAFLGGCVIDGIRMRTTSISDPGLLVEQDTIGNFEVTGPIVFREYYNNPEATRDAFTKDGWFQTGDLAIIDAAGQLNIVGRSKDVICINGIKYSSHEIEHTIEDARISSLTPGFTVCVPYRPDGAQTEQLAVLYLPLYNQGDNQRQEDIEARMQALNEITRVSLFMTGSRPYVLPLNRSTLVKTSLGKLSRNKIKNSLETGTYVELDQINTQIIKAYLLSHITSPQGHLETSLLEAALKALPVSPDEFGVETPFLGIAITSMELISFKKNAEDLTRQDIPMFYILTCPTVRYLARQLQDDHRGYDPVVSIRPNGTKTPLWLVHPVGGEVLVFVHLANLFTDRPVHGLRARGLNPGERPFRDIHEASAEYYTALKRKQPRGPYAVIGYSYGSLVAFEIAKLLDQNGDNVQFFGSLDLPPYHAQVISQGDWTTSLLHLASSISIIAETDMGSLLTKLECKSQDQAVQLLLTLSPPERLRELNMTAQGLKQWAHLTFAMTQAVKGYTPTGKIQSLDVFYTAPSDALGVREEEWQSQHRQWSRFGRLETRFHAVPGLHYRLLDKENVHSVYRILARAILAREL